MRSWLVGCVSFCLFSFCALSFSEVSIDYDSDKKRGVFFYNLHRDNEAIPLLEVAARAGDVESQYYLGDIERRKHFGLVTSKGRSWFEQAAGQGHLYAMLALTGSDIAFCALTKSCGPEHKTSEQWKAKALEMTETKANDGDSEAMLLMYYLTDDLNWLSRSADSGCVEAMYRLGREYGDGNGIFLTPNRRQLAADEWIGKAAEGGHLIAINDVVEMKSFKGDLKGVRYWTERGLKGGGFKATARYARWLSDAPSALADPNDLIRAYGLTLLLDEAESPGWRGREYRALEDIAVRLTSAQIKSGELFAQEWKRKYPPIMKDSR